MTNFIFTSFYQNMKIAFNNQNFEHKKVPRYIYHFTNEHAYNSMLKDGFIRTSENDPYIKKQGVHFIELSNFMKFWKEHKDWGEPGETLQKSLLRNVVRWIRSYFTEKNNLVVLRIPTASLDIDKLKIRSQHEFFKFKFSEQPSCKASPHLQGFTPATESRRYNNRKEAIEYIYQSNIPITAAERIGHPDNILDLRKNQHNIDLEILSRAFEGSTESKGLEVFR